MRASEPEPDEEPAATAATPAPEPTAQPPLKRVKSTLIQDTMRGGVSSVALSCLPTSYQIAGEHSETA